MEAIGLPKSTTAAAAAAAAAAATLTAEHSNRNCFFELQTGCLQTAGR